MKQVTMTTDELINFYKGYSFTRHAKEVHIHHTYAPSHANFNGTNHLVLQANMRSYHVNTNKWSDIGQHLTLFPDGLWVLGRDWNSDPASIKGRNNLGFAIEMIGNFDVGHDKLEGKQLEAIIKFASFLCLSVVFHREYASKSCPGTGVDKTWFVNKVTNYPYLSAIQRMISKGLLSSSDYWMNLADDTLVRPDYAEAIIKKLTGKTDITVAMNSLKVNGVIGAIDYWLTSLTNRTNIKGAFMKSLIIKAVDKFKI